MKFRSDIRVGRGAPMLSTRSEFVSLIGCGRAGLNLGVLNLGVPGH
jgi:hypothetical protein